MVIPRPVLVLFACSHGRGFRSFMSLLMIVDAPLSYTDRVLKMKEYFYV